ncbi:IS4/IS5 family transposase, partial [Paraburkholderia sediminicola]
TVADNLCTLLGELDTPGAEDLASRPNRLYALGAFKPILRGCLLRIECCMDRLADVIAVIHQTRCRIQPSRTYSRPPRKAKPHHHLAYKLA